MGWIALRDGHDGRFEPGGLTGGPAVIAPDPGAAALLARGTLLIEFGGDRPLEENVPILRLSRTAPWAETLLLAAEPGGALRFAHRQGTQLRSVRLPLPRPSSLAGRILSLAWDAPARQGWLSLYDPTARRLWQADLAGPMPLCLGDVREIAGAPLAPGLRWLAVSDRVEPAGPMPGLDGAARLFTPEGPVPISDLKRGQIVATAAGDRAQIRWVGSAEVISRGSQVPVMLRAPYHGLTRHIVAAPDQRIELGGTEIEYLFGVERVSAAVGDLKDGRSVLEVRGGPVRTAWQVLLDSGAAPLVEGAAIHALDIAPMLADPGVLGRTVLRDLPVELLPAGIGPEMPRLETYEAVTFAHHSAA